MSNSGLRGIGVIFIGIGLVCVLQANRRDLIESRKNPNIIDAIFEVVDD